MDKKSKIITYVAIGVILILLIVVAIMTRFSKNVPGITAYSENGATADALIGGYNWSTFLKVVSNELQDANNQNYGNENILLVKPGEKITLRNSGKDFDSYKFYQEYIKYYNSNGEVVTLSENEVPVNTESKYISFNSPQTDGTYIFDMSLNYHRKGNAQYSLKVVVSSMPSYSVESLVKYKNSYIGDAVKVGQILNALPYKEYRDGIVLRTANKPYELIAYYKDLEVDKESLRNNTIAIFALIDNVDIVTYQLDSKSFVYTRKELETILGRDLLEYANDIELWKKEVFYNVKDSANTDNLKIYRAILGEMISKISSDYIVIDLDSFNAIQISDAEKREVLKEFVNDGKIILEASNAEIRQRDTFKGVLVYADNISKTENGYTVSMIKYQSPNKKENVVYNVSSDGIIAK